MNPSLKVRDIMATRLVTLQENETVSLAEQLMHAVEIRHLPVLDSNNHLVGIVSDRDLLAAAASSISGLAPDQDRAFKRMISVAEIMNRKVEVVTPDTEVLVAAKRLKLARIGCLPVIEDDALVGIVTETDLLGVLVEALEGHQASNADLN